MPQEFTPYADESDVLRIGDLEVENRIDRLSITGDVVITKDKVGLALARELHSLLGRVVLALEADQPLSETVEVRLAETVKNPFA